MHFVVLCVLQEQGMSGRVAEESVHRGALDGLARLWAMCGEHEGEWVRSMLGQLLTRLEDGERVRGWPGGPGDVEFVQEHVEGESVSVHCGVTPCALLGNDGDVCA